jgi:hypothetical protein
MNAHLTRLVVVALTFSIVLAAVVPPAAVAATPAEEGRFVAAVKKAFQERKAAGLVEVTCWDRVGENERKEAQGVYAELVGTKDVTWAFALVEPPAKDLARVTKGDAQGRRPNLAITRQLDMTFRDKDGNRILGIIGWAVGEKDGRLMMVRSAPEK